MLINRKLFEQNTIAQHDDQDYSESGYAMVKVDEDHFCLFRYSHCSCYETWEALSGYSDYEAYDETVEVQNRQVTPDWEGTTEEMLALVNGNFDPAMPSRVANPDDYDYDHLMEVYKQIKEKYVPTDTV